MEDNIGPNKVKSRSKIKKVKKNSVHISEDKR